ncbi:hypothetical protein ON058_01240 [Demequina sp. B12]|uniref:ATP-grasp domain-containing protein n=1 Tax=Demequina sp. B12 TaxID=2992757 RepID=UPI00237B3248|nr:hypothetical protein [Demequina sp. B12]MDE0572036.1 hypothetical protein [Demequina sp. B12]
MTARIAIVTTVELAEPDMDEVLLLPLLPEAERVAWDDPNVDWSAYEVAVLRTTWNYTEHLPEFLAWADRVSAVTRLVNPLSVLTWNTDKRYLADLEARGLPVVPTVFVAPGESVPADALHGSVVVKPSVGAGSAGAALFHDDAAGALAHAQALHAADKTVMIQPYLEQVDTVGETAMAYLGGQFSHAARKAAILSKELSNSTGLYADEEISAYSPSVAERELADRAVATLTGVAYARVDLLPTDDGPVILELELAEPSLFLHVSEGAPERAAAAFRALLP